MNKQNELISKSYDKLYDQALDVTSAYNSKYIPLNTLFDLIKSFRMKENKKLGDFPKQYNKTLTLLYAHCFAYCNDNELDNKLPMVAFEIYINQLKKGLK